MRLSMFCVLIAVSLGGFAVYRSLLPTEITEFKGQVTEPQKMAIERQLKMTRLLDKFSRDSERLGKEMIEDNSVNSKPPSGGFVAPPPGTVYSIDKYGQTHHIR